MSIFKFLFDNDYMQRRDIEDLREQQLRLATTPSSGPSERWVRDISDEVKELAATVHVLMRKLAAANMLDLRAIEAEVEEELRPKKQRDAGPGTPVTCHKCSTNGMSNEMVRVGADWMCRNCARNP